MASNNKKFWTPVEEKQLIQNYKEFHGDLVKISERHARTARAIDMRLTKIIQDLKAEDVPKQHIHNLFGTDVMTESEFHERWHTKTQTEPPRSNSNSKSLIDVIKAVDEVKSELKNLYQKQSSVEQHLQRVIKMLKKKKNT